LERGAAWGVPRRGKCPLRSRAKSKIIVRERKARSLSPLGI